MGMGQLWFGTELQAQWVPHPVAGMIRNMEGYSEELSLDNGGLWVNRVYPNHVTYEMSFPVGDSSQYQGIEAFERYAAGEYGTGYLYFVDPMQTDLNLFTPNWAAPGLAERGWKPIFGTVPTYSDTGANSYTKPLRKATYNVDTAANAVPTAQNSVFTILIPTGYTLHIGGSGSVTGTAVLRIQPVNQNGTLATVVDVTLTSDATAPAFSRTFAASSYKAVRIYITRTTSAASTITLTSLWAQIHLNGVTPTISRHIPGKGHSGLKFRGSARAEVYLLGNGRHLTGASLSLAEVQPWE